MLNSFKQCQTLAQPCGLMGITVLTLFSAVSAPAIAADVKGFTTPNDAACALNPACALPRGGVSDVMTVFAPNGDIFEQIFAFGKEEAFNVYYFDNPLITIDPTQAPNFSNLLESDGSYSDIFGIVKLEGIFYLAFASDPAIEPIGSLAYYEEPFFGPWVSEPNKTFTIPYSATQYLSPDLQSQGYTAQFQSDYEFPICPCIVPEPSSVLAMVGLGLVGAGSLMQRKQRKA